MVVTVSGARQEVNQRFISACEPLDGAGCHQALVRSHATGLSASAESTGAIGEL